MSSLVDLIYSRYIRRYSTVLLVILLLILFSFVAYYGYKKFYANKKDEAQYNICFEYFYVLFLLICTTS